MTAEHRQAMGATIWTYLVLLDWTPKKSKTGKVLNGAIFTIAKIHEVSGYSVPQVQRDLAKLNGVYIELERTTRGFRATILNYRPTDVSTSKVDTSHDISTSKVDTSPKLTLQQVVEPVSDISTSKVDNSIRLKEELKQNKEIYAAWQEAKIINHKELSDSTEKAIQKALKTFSLVEVLAAIRNYGQVLNSKEFWWDHRWTLEQFIKGTGSDRIPLGNLKRFLDESKPLENYRQRSGANGNRNSTGIKPPDGDKYANLGG